MSFNIPRYIVWSSDRVDTNDPYQRQWLLLQILMRGCAQDIRALDLREVERELDYLDLPADIYSLWKHFLESRHVIK